MNCRKKNTEKENDKEKNKNKDKSKEKDKNKLKGKNKEKNKSKTNPEFGSFAFQLDGKWDGEIINNEVCFTYKMKTEHGRSWWNSDNCIPVNEFSNIPKNTDAEFTLTRDAGTVTFNGSFKNGEGEGSYSFKENDSFRNYLSQQGVGDVTEELMFHACINKIDKNYISSVKQMGFSLDGDEFKSIARFWHFNGRNKRIQQRIKKSWLSRFYAG